jgi:hypothetical protein
MGLVIKPPSFVGLLYIFGIILDYGNYGQCCTKIYKRANGGDCPLHFRRPPGKFTGKKRISPEQLIPTLSDFLYIFQKSNRVSISVNSNTYLQDSSVFNLFFKKRYKKFVAGELIELFITCLHGIKHPY